MAMGMGRRGFSGLRHFDLNVVDPAELQQRRAGFCRDPLPLAVGKARQRQTEHHTAALQAHLLDPLQCQQAATTTGILEGLKRGKGLGESWIGDGHPAELSGGLDPRGPVLAP